MVDICPPVTIYGVFMTALVLFDLYTSQSRAAMRNVSYGVLGCILLFVLCAAGMGFVAWGMLLLPVIFYLFLFAVILFDQSFLTVSHTYGKRRMMGPIIPGDSCESCDPEPSECAASECAA
jgi:hypothetical protein